MRRHLAYAGDAFAELVLWQLTRPVRGSPHQYKCRLAYIVQNVCVIRYDNES